MTAKHTQGDLHVNGWHLRHNGDIVADTASSPLSFNERAANATRLALCWNMHDRLVDMLGKLTAAPVQWGDVRDGIALLAKLDGAK